MARTQRYTVKQVEEALRLGAGIYTIASMRLKCAPNTVKNYVERHPRLQAVCAEIVEMNLDVAEHGLLKHLEDKNLGAILFYLRTKGRLRGYGDKLELAAKVKTLTVDLSTASDEQVRAWAAWDDDEAEAEADPSKA